MFEARVWLGGGKGKSSTWWAGGVPKLQGATKNFRFFKARCKAKRETQGAGNKKKDLTRNQ